MDLKQYEREVQQARRRFEALRATLAKRDGLTPQAKAAIVAEARARYDAVAKAVVERATAELAEERKTAAHEFERVRLARWSRFREVLGEVGAAVVFSERVKATDYAGRLELYRDADEWGKAIIGALTPTETPSDPAEAMAWYPLNQAIAADQAEEEREVKAQARALDGLELELERLDDLGWRDGVAASTGTWEPGRFPPSPLEEFSQEERGRATRDVAEYMGLVEA